MRQIEVTNWKKFQHYSKRRPPWIKLYTQVIDEFDEEGKERAFHSLPDQTKLALMLAWVLASRYQGHIPFKSDSWLKDTLGIKGKLDLEPAVTAGFISVIGDASNDASKSAIPRDRDRDREQSKDHAPRTPKQPTDPRVSILGNQISEAYLEATGLPLSAQGQMRKQVKAWLAAGKDQDEILSAFREYMASAKGFHADRKWGKFEGWWNEQSIGKPGPTFISPEYRGDCADIFGAKLP